MKKTILIFSLLLLVKGLYAQEYVTLEDSLKKKFDDKYRDEAISKSTYIFEGYILKQSAYKRDNKCIISYIVKISRVLRGNLKVGTIEILNNTSGLCFENRRDLNLIANKFDTSGFFFCKKATEFPFDKKYNIDDVSNAIILTGYHNNDEYGLDWISSSFRGFCYYLGLFKRFESKNDVYKYLLNYPNLNIPNFRENEFCDSAKIKRGAIKSYSRSYLDSIRNNCTSKKHTQSKPH